MVVGGGLDVTGVVPLECVGLLGIVDCGGSGIRRRVLGSRCSRDSRISEKMSLDNIG